MSYKHSENESPTANLKNESSRQRWDMFHRAIAHAKQSNDRALAEAESQGSDAGPSGPFLSIVR